MSTLVESESFQALLDVISVRLALDSLCIPNLSVSPDLAIHDVDPNKLFTQGTALAFSENEDAREAALKIAHFLLLSGRNARTRSLGLVLLHRLRNRISAELAMKKNLADRIPKPTFFSLLRQSAIDFVSYKVVNEERVYLNRFQGDFLEALANNQQIAVSAPTSAGKSFIVERWIAELLRGEVGGDVALIVPTRALIHQMELDMRAILASSQIKGIDVVTVPSEAFLSKERRRLLIFTQERFHTYLNLQTSVHGMSAVIVDEAQKIADGSRGVLLQQVIESAAKRYPTAKMVFLTPSSKNPQALFLPANGQAAKVESGEVTVGQNIYWLTQRPRNPKNWAISLIRPSGEMLLGTFSLTNKPGKVTERLSYIAFHLGGNDAGNIVYVNGPADAEKVASQIGGQLVKAGFEASDELKDLARAAADIIHPKYRLVNVLSQGVAFHYGNMPLLLRAEIERLFSEGKIRYLVCTSTLVEGVNTACRNLFLRGPERGQRQKMGSLDFWNLAGRAGRWGREFEGNIFCIDADRSDIWENGTPPRSREKAYIVKAAEEALGNTEAIKEGIASSRPGDLKRSSDVIESTVNYLYDSYYRDGIDAFEHINIERDWAKTLGQMVAESAAELAVSEEVVWGNPGINPKYMDSLLQYFRTRGLEPEEYIPPDPGSSDAVQLMARVFGRTYSHLGSPLGPGRRSFSLALLTTNWMRGYPLSWIIRSHEDYDRQNNPNRSLATTIRNVLNEIEQYARFAAPKYLSCYCDVLGQYFIESDRPDLVAQLDDFSLYLEFGASKVTQISLMSLGLSRTTAIAISEYLVDENLSRDEVFRAIKEIDVETLGVSRLVQNEIKRLVNSMPSKS